MNHVLVHTVPTCVWIAKDSPVAQAFAGSFKNFNKKINNIV